VSGVVGGPYGTVDSPTPLGRRLAGVVERREYGAYTVITVNDRGAPDPRPGQFYMLTAAERWGGGDDERPFLPRAFSVMRARDGVLDFLLEDVGPGTNRLCELDFGDGLHLLGPLGNGFAPPRDGRQAVLVGGGVGIAPLVMLDPATTLLGFRDAAHAEGAMLIPGARVATDDGSVGHHGFVTDLLDLAGHVEVYACGPPPMLDAVAALCNAAGVPAQLAMESGMACGFGACFGCVVPTRRGYVRLCVDGPVLEAADL